MTTTCLYVSIIIFIFFSKTQCSPLTKEENENRIAKCGINTAAKIYRGRVAEQSEAPWSVFMEHIVSLSNGSGKMNVCSATVVSPRHILIATHCFANASTVGWLNTKGFDRKNCEGEHYVIKDESVLNKIRFKSNNVIVARDPERVTLVNACALKTTGPNEQYKLVYDDFAIVELKLELPFSPTLQMVCVPRDTSDVKPGVELDFYAYGSDPSMPNGSSGTLRHETTQIFKDVRVFREYWFTARDPKRENIACPGDSGGGTVRNVNGRTTIIGVISQGSCVDVNGNIGDNRMEVYSAVGFYSKEICKLSGICDVTQSNNDGNSPNDAQEPEDDSEDSSHSVNSEALVLALTLVFLVLG